MARRGNGEGTVSVRADGRAEASLRYVDAHGEPQRLHVYGRTAKEARAKMKAARARLDMGAPARDSRMTVAACAEDWMVTALAAADLKNMTKSNYRSIARNHIVPPPFGNITLDRLRPSDVDGLLARKRAEGAGESLVRLIHTTLGKVLKSAVRDQAVARNVVLEVDRPRLTRKDARYLPADDVMKLLAVTSEHRLAAYFLLVAGTGMRRGEGLGLHWSDVDLDAGVLRIAGTLGHVEGMGLRISSAKAKSERNIPLEPYIVAALRAHRVRQVTEQLAAGPLWTPGHLHDPDSGCTEPLVFLSEVGTPQDPRNALRSWTTAAKKVGITGVGIHTLRHSAAVMLLKSGTHMKVIQELYGHSNYSITGDIYSHVDTVMTRTATASLGAALGR